MRLLKRKARRPESFEKLQLEKVIGLTTGNANGLACNFATGDVAYVAGCVVVIYNVNTNCQTKFLMVARTPKALACVAYSPHGGKLIAAGESGHQPAVLIWDVTDGSCLAELKSHKYGVSCVQFSPNGKHLVSAGFPHDGLVCLWDFKSAALIAKVRATTASMPISGIHVASDGSFFVTAGANHLKHWTIGSNAGRQRSGIGSGLVLDGRNVHLGSLRENSFVAVTSSEDSRDGDVQPVYALTCTGILCLLHRGLALKKWVNLKVRQGHGLAISSLHVACACSDGIVRIFMLESLAFAATLPRPAPFGFHDLTDTNTCSYLAAHNVNGISYPDAVACRFATLHKLAVVYADHSFFVWDTQNFSKIVRCQAFLPHSGCIWDVTSLSMHKKTISTGFQLSIESAGFQGGLDDQGAFATCSADGSIRLWCLDLKHVGEGALCETKEMTMKHGNAYDKRLLAVFYIDKRVEPEAKTVSSESSDPSDSCKGFRSLSVSLDGHYLAAGDRNGNLHVYDLQSLQIVNFKEAHDAEILTLSFGAVALMGADINGIQIPLLASGGRDRLVHIYDVCRNFDVIETLDDHSASITAAKFACGGFKLLSASADKSVVFRNIEATAMGIKSTRYHQEMASRGTVYDMDIDPYNKLAVTVGQDKKLNMLNLANGKSVRCFKPEGEVGEPIKVRIDPSGSYVVCSHSDKSMRMYDISDGSLLSLGQGHAEVITGIAFMPDCKRLISVSGDSCVFVWRLPNLLTKMMRKRCSLQSELQTSNPSILLADSKGQLNNTSSTPMRCDKSQTQELDASDTVVITTGPQLISSTTPAFKFSVSRLPHWARAKVAETILENDEGESKDLSFRSFESRWVERLGPEGYKLYSEPQIVTPPATIHPSNFGARRRFTIEPGGTTVKDHHTPQSSLDSQPSGTSCSSPKASERKDTFWKTVHTLFFDEEDCLEDDATSESYQLRPVAGIGDEPDQRDARQQSTVIESQNQMTDDGMVVYLSDDELDRRSEPSRNVTDGKVKPDNQNLETGLETPAPLVYMVNSRNGRALTVFNNPKQLTQKRNLESTFENEVIENVEPKQVGGKAIVERQREEEQVMVPTSDDTSDDEDTEQFISPDNDLFNAHFGKLSTAMKFQTGQASARSSFSARFFAQSSHAMPVISLFQGTPVTDRAPASTKTPSPLEVEPMPGGSLLAKERECLKLKERQDMTTEKQSVDLGSITTDALSLVPKQDIKDASIENERQDIKDASIETEKHIVAKENVSDSQTKAEHCVVNLLSFDSVPEVPCSQANEVMELMPMKVAGLQDNVSSAQKSPLIDSEILKTLESLFPCEADSACCTKLVSQKEMESSLGDLIPIQSGCTVEVKQDFHAEEQKFHGPSTDLATGTFINSVGSSETENEFKIALQELSLAAEKALSSFRSLQSRMQTDTQTAAMNLSRLHQEFMSPTLQNVWCLSDSMSCSSRLNNASTPTFDNSSFTEYTNGSLLDQHSLRLSNNGVTSRPDTSASVTLSNSVLESIDIEGFIHQYSVRFSTTLASQVLELVQKGLSAPPS